MPRFIHTADWQIGRQYGQFDPDDGVPLAEARFQAVAGIAALATAEAATAVLVAGDVFDAQTVSDRTLRRLFGLLEGFAGPWIMIPGNHDAALAESVWRRAQRLEVIPAHAHVILQPAVLSFAELGFAVLAAPLTQRHTYSDVTAFFDGAETADGLIRIGLAHGSVQGVLPDSIDSPNPIDPRRAASARLDYLALGDWHGTRVLDARTAYSGTPEPDRFKANDAGQVLVVDIDAPGAEPRIAPRPSARFRWREWTASVAVPSDIDALIERLADLGPADVLTLTVTGQTDLAGHRRLGEALDGAEGRARSLQRDLGELRLIPTDEDIAALHADGYLGEVIGELREAQTGPNAETAREALAVLTAILGQNGTAPRELACD